ncbi:MAG: hypothetical protein J7L23_02180 [Candidatus Diapherotrites archaeon]|nr:hypothetical protein [Candidatus Diapherotrites archaeon]
MKLVEKIPEEPSVPLYNYLLDLVGEEDGKECSLYLNNANSFIEDLWGEIVRKNYRKLKVQQLIPQEFGITTPVFYEYKNGRKRVPIQTVRHLIEIWARYCNKTNKELQIKWLEVFEGDFRLSTHSKHQKTKLPQDVTPKLAYLMGWMIGDGHLKKMHNYLVKISEKSVDQLTLVLKPLFEEIFGVDAPIFRRYMGGYALQIGSKPIYRFMKNVLHIRVGEIPTMVWKWGPELKRYLLVGIFDSEGYVGSGSNRQVSISQADKTFLVKLIYLFGELDITFTGPYLHKTVLGKWYSIRIKRKSELVKFAKSVGSFHIEKSKKLAKVVRELEKGRKY